MSDMQWFRGTLVEAAQVLKYAAERIDHDAPSVAPMDEDRDYLSAEDQQRGEEIQKAIEELSATCDKLRYRLAAWVKEIDGRDD